MVTDLETCIGIVYFHGTMASPMSTSCDNREIARRALFLLGFLNDAEGK